MEERLFAGYWGDGLLVSAGVMILAGREPGASLLLGSVAPLIGGTLLWTRFRQGSRAFETPTAP